MWTKGQQTVHIFPQPLQVRAIVKSKTFQSDVAGLFTGWMTFLTLNNSTKASNFILHVYYLHALHSRFP